MNNWLDYANIFESLVNKNEYLDNIRRFHYLRSSLQGGAAQIIRTLEFTAENYEIAWKLVRERYDNNRLLISNHVNALFNIEPINKESSGRLRQLVDIFSKHLYALKQLGLPTEYWDVLLNHIISSTFDTYTLRAWENSKTTNEIPSFDDFKTFLKSRADLLESIEANQAEKQNTRNNSQAGAYPRNTKNSQNTRGLYSSQDTPNNTDSARCCPMCKGEHAIYQCGEFLRLSSKERFDKVRKMNLCTNCLKGGHYYRRCKQSTCKRCSSKHHTYLHPDRSSERNTPSMRQPVVNASENQAVDDLQGTLNTTNLTASAVSSKASPEQSILSTVLVNIVDGQGNSYAVRALLDCGSQSSFITENLCDRLRIKRSRVDISVLGINNASSPVRFSQVHDPARRTMNLTEVNAINNFDKMLVK
ncbi:uncharacterized protein LOC126892046 [Diabrotica virgifera virgifera]|uniref:Peptidase aspartic putative domain-containing protein n=1 Tax=Diabrotica virgifera virgifera TaxID=50390 RepID=A0ABM5L4S0_DIAVI|nr:uncharacterized protein LOC126892046 [Diabrotica virgifera virgifera]